MEGEEKKIRGKKDEQGERDERTDKKQIKKKEKKEMKEGRGRGLREKEYRRQVERRKGDRGLIRRGG